MLSARSILQLRENRVKQVILACSVLLAGAQVPTGAVAGSMLARPRPLGSLAGLVRETDHRDAIDKVLEPQLRVCSRIGSRDSCRDAIGL
jgi:hypothetical protein